MDGQSGRCPQLKSFSNYFFQRLFQAKFELFHFRKLEIFPPDRCVSETVTVQFLPDWPALALQQLSSSDCTLSGLSLPQTGEAPAEPTS